MELFKAKKKNTEDREILENGASQLVETFSSRTMTTTKKKGEEKERKKWNELIEPGSRDARKTVKNSAHTIFLRTLLIFIVHGRLHV